MHGEMFPNAKTKADRKRTAHFAPSHYTSAASAFAAPYSLASALGLALDNL
jgi:hypothetical protein